MSLAPPPTEANSLPKAQAPSARSGPILPGGATLGVLGGGQLGRMFVHAAQELGYHTVVLDPDAASPAGQIAHHHVQCDYLDAQGLADLAHRCHAVTTEFENVPARALATLAARLPVAPGAEAVAVCQDRVREKAHFSHCGVPCAPHALIADEAQLQAVDPALLPGILKTASMGYDGKGQATVHNADQLAAAWDALKRVPCVLEKRLDLAFEVSVIVARNAQGELVHFPLQQNLHRGGILAVTTVPAPDVTPELQAQAVRAAETVAASMGYVGVLCVEFFVLTDGTLVANEMAPRPHNSGHYTLDACDVSQFDLQVRAMTGLPLPAPRLHSPAIMLNLLGDLWFRDGSADAATPSWERVLTLPGTHLHLYGKLSARPGRKMGHLNITGASATQVREVALRCCELLGLAPF